MEEIKNVQHNSIIKNETLPIIFSISLFVIGALSLSGISVFGSALLEGAAWKQNVIYCILIFFCLLPPIVRNSRATSMAIGYSLAFFMFGGSNIIGTVGIIISLIKVAFPILIIYQGIRLWILSEKHNKWLLVLSLAALVLSILIIPIQDQNIVQSGIDAIIEFDSEKFTDDGGFHYYIGGISIITGIIEFLITYKHLPNKSKCIESLE